MKFILTLSLLCLSCLSIFAETMQITLLATDRYNIGENGILKGAKEYASKATIRFGKDIHIDIEQAESNESIKQQILSLKEQGINGVILSLSDIALEKDFDNFLAQVSCDTFAIAIINPKRFFENALVQLKPDRQKEVELILSFTKEKSRHFHSKTIYILEGENFRNINENEASALIVNIFNKEEFNTLCSNTKDNNFFTTNNISNFSKNLEEYIKKLDSYSLIIANRKLLEDLSTLKADSDRLFILSLETNAFSLANMESGLLNATIVQDFFGYGVLSSKALVEKILEGISPSEKLQKLSPTLYTTDSLEELKETCLYWLK